MAGAIIMRVVYGYSIQGTSDPYVTIADNALRTLQLASGLSAPHLVDRFPVLSSVPAWLPGIGWKRRALAEKHWVDEMSERPWRWTQNEMVSSILSVRL